MKTTDGTKLPIIRAASANQNVTINSPCENLTDLPLYVCHTTRLGVLVLKKKKWGREGGEVTTTTQTVGCLVRNTVKSHGIVQFEWRSMA